MKDRRCEYRTELMEEYDTKDPEEGIILVHTNKFKRCRRLGRYGINGVYYCWDHKRDLEIVHMERMRR